MRWVIKKLLAHSGKFSKKQARRPRTHICYHDNNIATVEKGLIDSISKQEQFIELVKELGPNGFADWYMETFGEQAPHIDMKIYKSAGRFNSPRTKIKQSILKELKGEDNG